MVVSGVMKAIQVRLCRVFGLRLYLVIRAGYEVSFEFVHLEGLFECW